MRAVATIVAAGLAALVALMLGEYEFTGFVPVAAGLGVGFALGQVFLMAGWRGVTPAAIAAVLTGASLAWAGWIDSSQGLDPYPRLAWLAVAIGAATAAVSVAPRRRRRKRGTVGADGVR